MSILKSTGTGLFVRDDKRVLKLIWDGKSTITDIIRVISDEDLMFVYFQLHTYKMLSGLKSENMNNFVCGRFIDEIFHRRLTKKYREIYSSK